MTTPPVTWNDVPQSAIDKELAFWKSRKAKSIWLVPCRYEDGEPTCMGSLEMPYSNPLRRLYTLSERWEQQY